VIRGDLTPECAAAVFAVIDALGKRRGQQDDRSEAQRRHDALAEACHLLLRARMVPSRAGAPTPKPSCTSRSRSSASCPAPPSWKTPGSRPASAGQCTQPAQPTPAHPAHPGTVHLAGRDAEVAACDALTVPVVTGHADLAVIDKIIAQAGAHSGPGPALTLGTASPSLCDRPAGHRLCLWPR